MVIGIEEIFALVLKDISFSFLISTIKHIIQTISSRHQHFVDEDQMDDFFISDSLDRSRRRCVYINISILKTGTHVIFR